MLAARITLPLLRVSILCCNRKADFSLYQITGLSQYDIVRGPGSAHETADFMANAAASGAV
jgi:hypothetical protein